MFFVQKLPYNIVTHYHSEKLWICRGQKRPKGGPKSEQETRQWRGEHTPPQERRMVRPIRGPYGQRTEEEDALRQDSARGGREAHEGQGGSRERPGARDRQPEAW